MRREWDKDERWVVGQGGGGMEDDFIFKRLEWFEVSCGM